MYKRSMLSVITNFVELGNGIFVQSFIFDKDKTRFQERQRKLVKHDKPERKQKKGGTFIIIQA